jgi:hypothetical protein
MIDTPLHPALRSTRQWALRGNAPLIEDGRAEAAAREWSATTPADGRSPTTDPARQPDRRRPTGTTEQFDTR